MYELGDYYHAGASRLMVHQAHKVPLLERSQFALLVGSVALHHQTVSLPFDLKLNNLTQRSLKRRVGLQFQLKLTEQFPFPFQLSLLF